MIATHEPVPIIQYCIAVGCITETHHACGVFMYSYMSVHVRRDDDSLLRDLPSAHQLSAGASY